NSILTLAIRCGFSDSTKRNRLSHTLVTNSTNLDTNSLRVESSHECAKTQSKGKVIRNTLVEVSYSSGMSTPLTDEPDFTCFPSESTYHGRAFSVLLKVSR